jgi:hypothetical protein
MASINIPTTVVRDDLLDMIKDLVINWQDADKLKNYYIKAAQDMVQEWTDNGGPDFVPAYVLVMTTPCLLEQVDWKYLHEIAKKE